jgi:hypothetical protein
MDSHCVLIVLLVDCRRPFIVGGNLGNLASIVILQLVDVADNLVHLSTNSCASRLSAGIIDDVVPHFPSTTSPRVSSCLAEGQGEQAQQNRDG